MTPQHELDGGKYVFTLNDEGIPVALRNGESWQEFRGSKFLLALFEEITDLKQRIHAYQTYHDLREEYERAPSNSRELWLKLQNANVELQILRNKER